MRSTWRRYARIGLPPTAENSPWNVTRCTTCVPSGAGARRCSKTMQNSGILDSTVKQRSCATSVSRIGTVLPFVGVSQPRLPAWKGPWMEARLVSGWHKVKVGLECRRSPGAQHRAEVHGQEQAHELPPSADRWLARCMRANAPACRLARSTSTSRRAWRSSRRSPGDHAPR